MILDSAVRGARILFLGALLIAVPGIAAAETFITIEDVSVDVTAKSAAVARDVAIANVQAKAFARLIKQMAPNPDDQARLNPTPAEIEGFVQDFAVESERTSAVRYIGRYRVRFRSSQIHQYLAANGVASIGEPLQVLVLPVYKTAAGPVLWNEGNPWRAAWERGGFGDGPVTLILPNGDPFDSGTVTPLAAESGDIGALVPLIERYHAAGIVVAEAVPIDPAKGAASGLVFTVTIYDSNGPKDTQTIMLDAMPRELADAVFRRGVGAVSDALNGKWQQAIAETGSIGLRVQETGSNQPGSVRLYPIAMPVAGIGDWVKARDALSTIPGFQRLSLDALTRKMAALTLNFSGDPLALETALADSGFVLVQTAPGGAAGLGSFELRAASSPPPPPASPATPSAPAVQ